MGIATGIIAQLSQNLFHSELSLQSKRGELKRLIWLIFKQRRNDVKLNQESFNAVITPKGSTPLPEAGMYFRVASLSVSPRSPKRGTLHEHLKLHRMIVPQVKVVLEREVLILIFL